MPAVETISPWGLVEAFRRVLHETYGPRLKAVILYGSLARGEWTPESDIDLLILLDDACEPVREQEVVRALRDRVAPPAQGPVLQPLVLREGDYARGQDTLFFNVRREGWWLMPDGEVAPVRGLMERARQNIRDAQQLLSQESLPSAVSRAYYAMFNAAQAALLMRGITRSRHTGVHSAFHEYFIRTGHIPPDLYDALVRAYEKRNLADYSPRPLERWEAQEVVADAHRFVEAIENLVHKEGL
ncbi:MAG: HEPN domain-containing protein [Dehalococcoidia bacterium]